MVSSRVVLRSPFLPLGAILFFCTLWGMGSLSAQSAPEIDPASMEALPGSVLRFQFHAVGGSVEDFQIEIAPALANPPVWTLATSATLEALSEGRFRVIDTVASEPRFYRVRALPQPVSGAQVWINEVVTENVTTAPDPDGKFWDWIELYNPNDEAVDLAGYALSDDRLLPGKWRFPSVLIQPQGFLLVYASDLNLTNTARPLHTNFKLKGSGETLLLSDPADHLLDQVEVPPLMADQSMGRVPDGAGEFGFFPKASVTPGAPNPGTIGSPALGSPKFVPEGGFYSAPVTIQVVGAEAGHVVHYTLNGSLPTAQSPVITSTLTFSNTTVLRVLALDGSGRKSDVVARTYFIGVSHQLPVVSLATAPSNMEFRNGYLYGMGPSVLNAQGQVLQNYPYSGSNAWQDREVEVSLEFFEPGGGVGLRQRAGMKVYGGWGSRGYPQKSLALFARRSYGAGKFKHEIFPGLGIDEFESFVLRNSGNDNQSTHQTPPRPPITAFGPTTSYGSYFVNGGFTMLRDAFEQRLLDGTTLDTQAYRPAVVYVNGDYWGIFNLREKVTEHQVASHHHLPSSGSIDLIEGYGDVRAGSATVYNQLRQFLASKNMAVGTNFAFVENTYLDIDNFIDYHLAVIYFQNFDIGNIKCWRPRQPGGRFRWLVYDQDYGFGLWPAAIYEPAMARDYADYSNMFKFYTAGTGTSDGWPNAGGRTLMLRSLLANPGFKVRFIRRCADLLNSLFREDRVEQTLQSMAAVIRPEIGAHLNRWSWTELVKRGYGKPHQPEYRPFVRETWETNLAVVSAFGQARPAKLRQDCMTYFGLKKGLGVLSVEVSPAGSGLIKVNSLRPETLPWSGVYFADITNTLRAVPAAGQRFAGWLTSTGRVDGWTLEGTVTAGTTNQVVALMEPAAPDSGTPSDLVITEIQYHPPTDGETGDWIELYNRGKQPVDLTGWVLRDGANLHGFLLPSRTLEPGAWLVVCEDLFRFRLFQPAATIPALGDLGFGLDNKGDFLRLYRPDGTLAVSVPYRDVAPWPVEADGVGSTLELISTSADPALPSSWKASSVRGGTPGRF